jgi:nucleoside-diphosphate-sugar epimerase
MRLAILGATSQIAKDLVRSFAAQSNHELVLFARRPEVVTHWLTSVDLPEHYPVHDFKAFNTEDHFDAILNFVGVGNPAQAVAMGAAIFDVTLQYDELALSYVRLHPACRYIFLSSGAAYGSSFDAPVYASSKAVTPINNLGPKDWYAVAKLHAECRHRSLMYLPIVDIRVFNYFSHTQDISAQFLITNIARAIYGNTVLRTSPEYIVRDFLHPTDFYQLVSRILGTPHTNEVVDCFSNAPIDKPSLLHAMQEHFGLKFTVEKLNGDINATGVKPHYYSLNRRAANFGYSPIYTSKDGIIKEMILLQERLKATLDPVQLT